MKKQLDIKKLLILNLPYILMEENTRREILKSNRSTTVSKLRQEKGVTY